MFRTQIVRHWVGGTRLRRIKAEATCLLLLLFAGNLWAEELKLHRQSATHMGTIWHIALYSSNQESANVAFAAAWSVIGDVDAALTNYDANSELNQLCAGSPHADCQKVSDHLWRNLRAADALSRLTDGQFDVTIGPISKLWRRARAKKQLPTSERLAEAMQSVGYQLVHYCESERAVKLTKPGMKIDLGGIAKGYAVDQALAAIRACGIEAMLINGGGDLAVGAAPPGEAGWAIDVAGLDPKQHPRQIRLKHQAIATSGDAWQFLEIDGKRYSHLIHPKTGIGTTQRATVSIIAPTCMQADSWASAFCILDWNRSRRLLATAPNVSARVIVVDERGRTAFHASPNFP